jgi:hypothetical protein
MDDDGSLGWRFVGSVFGICLAIGVGGFLLFWLVGTAWYAWGAFGALIFLGGMLLLGAWIYDRSVTKTPEDLT